MNQVSAVTTATASLLNQIESSSQKNGADDAQQLRLQNVANEFEALMMSLVLKEMRKSLSPSQGLFGGDSSDTYGGMFDMFMGQSLAEASPLGVAEMIQQYGRNYMASGLT